MYFFKYSNQKWLTEKKNVNRFHFLRFQLTVPSETWRIAVFCSQLITIRSIAVRLLKICTFSSASWRPAAPFTTHFATGGGEARGKQPPLPPLSMRRLQYRRFVTDFSREDFTHYLVLAYIRTGRTKKYLSSSVKHSFVIGQKTVFFSPITN